MTVRFAGAGEPILARQGFPCCGWLDHVAKQVFEKLPNVLSPSLKQSRYENRAGQTFLTFTRFIENMCNIYISK
jgi:hypothetical protein